MHALQPAWPAMAQLVFTAHHAQEYTISHRETSANPLVHYRILGTVISVMKSVHWALFKTTAFTYVRHVQRIAMNVPMLHCAHSVWKGTTWWMEFAWVHVPRLITRLGRWESVWCAIPSVFNALAFRPLLVKFARMRVKY